eukprot:5843297-Pleurochrysis_carterae.AAC.2
MLSWFVHTSCASLALSDCRSSACCDPLLVAAASLFGAFLSPLEILLNPSFILFTCLQHHWSLYLLWAHSDEAPEVCIQERRRGHLTESLSCAYSKSRRRLVSSIVE